MAAQDAQGAFRDLFHEQLIANNFKILTEGSARSSMSTVTADSPSGKTLRYSLEGETLMFEVWPTGNESLETNVSFHWDGQHWLEPKLRVSFPTSELVTHLIHSGQ